MRVFKLALLLFLFSQSLYSQQKYSKIKVYANKQQLSILANNGIAVDHGLIKKNNFIISDFSETELNIIIRLGYAYDILIENVSDYYKNQNNSQALSSVRSNCSSSINYQTPLNFNLGSMAGFLKYNEYLAQIDSMAAKFPNLITIKQQVGSFNTYEGRPLYWLKISDNPSVDENEPEVFYSAIHHAREVASLSQLIFYMWYVLENYGTDPEITALVNNTEMFFIPLVNPDGYIYNETTRPNGGGLWRKNRVLNSDNTRGVDLNRNYGYQWGGLGASTNTSSDTYRGPSAFSEQETKAIKWFCEQHQFKMALNAHTYSNLLLYPYGYATNAPTPENNIFKAFSNIMVRENGYNDIISSGLYAASGTSDDWFYGEQSSKPKIYAMTPEIGSSFWPAQNEIINLCKENVFMNLMNAKLAGRYASITEEQSFFVQSLTEQIRYDVKRLGLAGNGDFTVSLSPISANISSIGSNNIHTGMNLLQTINDSIEINLSNTIQLGDEIKFAITVNNGLYIETDTITKTYGLGQLIYSNTGNTNNWNASGTWSTTTNSFKSPSTSITDSPFGNYPDLTTSYITTNAPIVIPNGSKAFLSFWAKWDIEAGWDYIQVEASNDNGIYWNPLCGKYTKEGNGNQATGEPLYDGISDWVHESIDISLYLNSNVLFRYKLVSDQAENRDGFYFDDMEVRIIPSSTTSIEEHILEDVFLYPNPTTNTLFVKIENIEANDLRIFDSKGKLIKQIKKPSSKINLFTGDFKNGIYYISISGDKNKVVSKRFTVLR